MPPNSVDLDLFILALVQRGCATPYDLKAKAGISIGSSAPVLERLADDGQLKKSGRGIRDKVQFSVTKLGEKKLGKGWQALLATRPTDPDAILRIVFLAWALGEQDVLEEFIDSAADSLRNAAAVRRAEAGQVKAACLGVGAEAFRWLKTSLEAARIAAQSKELKELGEQIRKQKKK